MFYFTFPSRYWFTIGCSVIFSLTRWSSQIQKGFHVSFSTWDSTLECICFQLQDFHFLRHSIQPVSSNKLHPSFIVPQPFKIDFRLLPLLKESLLLSFPPVTKMFQFTGYVVYFLCGLRNSSRIFIIWVFLDQNLLSSLPRYFAGSHAFIAFEHQGIHHELLFT